VTDISLEWHNWERLKLRTILPSQWLAIEKGEMHYSIDEPSRTDQRFIHRLVQLLWIGEFEFARKLFDSPEYYHSGYSLEEYLFNLVICVRDSGWVGWYFSHPEYKGVHYAFLYGDEAFKKSTAPLSDLIKMDSPCFSSIDGLVDVKFDKTELERVANVIPEDYHKELRLPLILFGPLGNYPGKYDYQGKYKLLGGKAEEFLLQNLLKLTDAPFDEFKETRGVKLVYSISTLKRRKFETIYRVIFELERAESRSEMSGVWLNARYDPYWPKSIQAPLIDKF